MAANSGITEDMRTNRVLYRACRDRVLSRTQIHHLRGSNALIARMVALGWLEPAGDRFALTQAGEAAHAERVANGNYATC